MQGYFYSIIIPTRGLTSYLEKDAFPSIQKQTYSSFEVIILTESPQEFDHELKKYPWLKVLSSKGAPGKKRDEGAAIAKGEILVFIDDDVEVPVDWLEKITALFMEKPDQKVLGGPGILPKNVNIWEHIFDQILLSPLGSGGYRYRFTREKERFIDDYPSMNIIIRKDLFLEVGGFNNDYWPGEDSKLGELLKSKGTLIWYHPDIFIYHHRREDLVGFLKQHMRYGAMRGTFFAHGDTNSRRLSYLIPLFFCLYLMLLFICILNNFWEMNFLRIVVLPLVVYLTVLIFTAVQSLVMTKNILITLGLLFVLPLTHIAYGFSFMKGLMTAIKA